MKATLRQILWPASLTLAMVGMTACTSIFGEQSVQLRAVENMPGRSSGQHNPYYESAKTAINARDYARALDYLQEARSRDPRDAEVLNALGVVYDKLGRFDLSTRYYAQASAADPNSDIISANIAYSKVLQGFLNPGPSMAVASAQAPSNSIIIPLEQKPIETQAAPPIVIAAAVAHDSVPAEKRADAIAPARSTPIAAAVPREMVPTLPATKEVLTIGHAVKVMNASGRTDGIVPISRRLKMLGWTVRGSETGRVQSVTTLFYPLQNTFVAQAMQRTLPFPVRLTPDVAGATGIRLVMGSDYLAWKPKNAYLAALWQGRPVVASMSSFSQMGIR